MLNFQCSIFNAQFSLLLRRVHFPIPPEKIFLKMSNYVSEPCVVKLYSVRGLLRIVEL